MLNLKTLTLIGTWCALEVALGGLGHFQACAQDAEPEVRPATAQEILADVRQREADVKVVNFWATWCVPCRQEFPEFVQLGKDLAGKVDVIFVSADFEEALPDAKAFLAEQGVTVSYLKQEKDNVFIPAFHEDWTGALPATLLYDADGSVRDFWEGKTTYDVLRARVEAILSE